MFPTIKQPMKQCTFPSLSNTHANTRLFLCLLQTRSLLPLVTGKDIDVEALGKGFLTVLLVRALISSQSFYKEGAR